MSELSNDQIEACKASLLELEKVLEEQLHMSKSAADIVTLDQTLVGRVSRMDAMQQQGMALSTRDKARKRLRRVRLALKALAEGDYGYCRQCDEAVNPARLMAQPEAGLCISCQSRADQQ